MSTSRGGYLKYLALLTYLLLLAVVFTLLVKEWPDKEPVFSLSGIGTKINSGQVTLEVYGEHFHSGIKGVLTKSLVNEEALLWHHYKDIPFRVFDKRENLLLASYRSNKLVSLSLSDEAAPKLLGSIDVAGIVGQIKLIDNMAVVGMTRSHGVSIIDMIDPERLTIAAHFPIAGSVFSIVEGHGFVYVTGVGMGVARLDLTEKKPEIVTFAKLDSPWRMAIQGQRLAVATLKGRVHLFEIRGAGQPPVEVGSLDFPAAVLAVSFTGEKLVVAAADNSLSAFSLSEWPALETFALLNLPEKAMAVETVPGQESVVVSLVSNGFSLVDVSPPEKPAMRSWLRLPQSTQSLKVNPEQIIATGSGGLQAFYLAGMGSEDLSPRVWDAVDIQVHYRLGSWNEYIYGFDKHGVAKILGKTLEEPTHLNRYLPLIDADGIGFYDQQQNGQLQKLGSLSLREEALDVQSRGGYLYVLHHEGLRVFSGVSPETMVAISDLRLTGRPQSFEFLSSTAIMISSRDQGLSVVDIESPEEPKVLSGLTLPRHLQSSVTRDMLVDGSRLYVSWGMGGVQIFDISTPLHPALIQVVETPGHARRMALHDGLLLVAVRNSGLFVIDVEDPAQALPVGLLPVPLRIDQMAVAEDGLIIGSRYGGTMKLPLPQRLHRLRLVNEGEIEVDVDTVEKGQYVYLYDRRSAGRIAVDVP